MIYLLRVAIDCQTISDYLDAMKNLILAAFLLSACTLPQVIYVDRPSDAAFWNMPASQPWVVDPGFNQPQPVQAPRIPQWCRDPISHTVIPC
jgi:hypothetical protein